MLMFLPEPSAGFAERCYRKKWLGETEFASILELEELFAELAGAIATARSERPAERSAFDSWQT